jgi:RNA ligase
MVMEKLDGSMVHTAMVNGDLHYMTRMGITPVSEQAHFFAFDHTARGGPKYAEFCTSLMKNGYTPIFEWTSPHNRIVLKYAEPQLTLLAIRKMDTGEYTPYGAMLNECKLWGIPCVSDIRTELVPTDLIAAIKSWENREGIVVRFPAGQMVKVKADAYVLRHKAKAAIEREKNVLHLVLEGAVDDLVAMLDDDAEKLLGYASDVRKRVSESAKYIRLMIASARMKGYERKDFALKYAAGLPPILKAPAFQVWDGKDPIEAITEMMKKKCGSQTSVDLLAPILRDTRWTY